jgi:hypothetical protein
MKHGNAGEYDRVRRHASIKKQMDRERERGFEEEPRDTDRVQAALDDFNARMAVLEEAEIRAKAERLKHAFEFTMRANEAVLIREWQAAGVECLWKDQRGVPTMSYSLAKMFGWTIREKNGTRTLVKPPPPRKPERREAPQEPEDSIKDTF